MEAGLFTLVGVIIGAVLTYTLTRKWQREQWLMDRRHEEFQEVMRALDDSMYSEATSNNGMMELTAAERRDKARKTSDFFKVLRTRIYTRNELEKLDIQREWRAALATYQQDNDGPAFGHTYDAIVKKLVHAATSPKARTSR